MKNISGTGQLSVIISCVFFQVPYYVEAFDASAYRLAIPRMFDASTNARVVLNRSSWMLLVCAILPSASFGFVWAVVTFRELIIRIDNFIDLNMHLLLRFPFRLRTQKFYVKVASAFITLWVFLVFIMLSGEVTSFTEPVRIPKSNCRYDRCRIELFSELMGYTDHWDLKAGPVFSAYFSPSNDISQLKLTRECSAGELRMAHQSSTFLDKSILAVLFLNMALCGKKDILNLRIQSLNQRGLLVEERVELMRPLTQFCLMVNVPWLQRPMLEQSLFSFVHFGMFRGSRIGENLRERDLWNGKKVFHYHNRAFEGKVATLGRFLEQQVDQLKKLYLEDRMWFSDREFVLDLDSQKLNQRLLEIGLKASIVAILVERFMQEYNKIMFMLRPSR